MGFRDIALVALLITACGGAQRGGLAEPAVPEGWIHEKPELAALFPEGEPVAIAETWSRGGDGWRHCYEVEAPMREGERERFVRAAERLGYAVGETAMGAEPAFTSGDVSATQSLPSEGSSALFEALGDRITEGQVPTVTVRVCITGR